MKVRKKVAATLAVGAAALTMTACGNGVDPCTTLTPPSDAAVQAAREGIEVESELSDGTECLVDPETGRYVNTGTDD
jgi:ABC-type glycerol-3-phosphate transport system substrate-binding protein